MNGTESSELHETVMIVWFIGNKGVWQRMFEEV